MRHNLHRIRLSLKITCVTAVMVSALAATFLPGCGGDQADHDSSRAQQEQREPGTVTIFTIDRGGAHVGRGSDSHPEQRKEISFGGQGSTTGSSSGKNIDVDAKRRSQEKASPINGGAPFAGGPGSAGASHHLGARRDSDARTNLPDPTRTTNITETHNSYGDLAALKKANDTIRTELAESAANLSTSAAGLTTGAASEFAGLETALKALRSNVALVMGAIPGAAASTSSPSGPSSKRDGSSYPFATDSATPFGRRLFGAWQFRTYVHEQLLKDLPPDFQNRLAHIQTADLMLDAADLNFQDAEIEAGDRQVSWSLILLDLAIGATPYAGDAYALEQLSTGFNPILQEKLTDLDYAMQTTGLLVSAWSMGALRPAVGVAVAATRAIAHVSGPAVLRAVRILNAIVERRGLGATKAGKLLQNFVRADAQVAKVLPAANACQGGCTKVGDLSAAAVESLARAEGQEALAITDLARRLENVASTAEKIGLHGDDVSKHMLLIDRVDPRIVEAKLVDLDARNAASKAAGREPEYLEGTKGLEFKQGATKRDYVRLHTADPKSVTRAWVARVEDVKDLSPADLQRKFNLPTVPTHASRVTPDAGTPMRASYVGPNKWGNGQGAVQFEIDMTPGEIEKMKVPWFNELGEITGTWWETT